MRDPHRTIGLLVLLGLVALPGMASGQSTVLERAVDPFRYVAAVPEDPCRYSPCPAVDLTLDRISGAVSPTHEFGREQRIRMAVVNLNPFIHQSIVTVDVRPLDPDAPPDFLNPLVITRAAGPPPPPALPPLLEGCVISPDQRTRLRISAGRVLEARVRMDTWLTDSLAGPRGQVEDRVAELQYTMTDQGSEARELFAAAWQYRELARVYGPALLASGLADSSRIVPLATYFEAFAEEVGSIMGCEDLEMSAWKNLILATASTLRLARDQVATARSFVDDMTDLSRRIWGVASVPSRFYQIHSAGGYTAPRNVFVRLYLLGPNEPRPRQLDEADACAGWTLIFH